MTIKLIKNVSQFTYCPYSWKTQQKLNIMTYIVSEYYEWRLLPDSINYKNSFLSAWISCILFQTCTETTVLLIFQTISSIEGCYI